MSLERSALAVDFELHGARSEVAGAELPESVGGGVVRIVDWAAEGIPSHDEQALGTSHVAAVSYIRGNVFVLLDLSESDGSTGVTIYEDGERM